MNASPKPISPRNPARERAFGRWMSRRKFSAGGHDPRLVPPGSRRGVDRRDAEQITGMAERIGFLDQSDIAGQNRGSESVLSRGNGLITLFRELQNLQRRRRGSGVDEPVFRHAGQGV